MENKPDSKDTSWKLNWSIFIFCVLGIMISGSGVIQKAYEKACEQKHPYATVAEVMDIQCHTSSTPYMVAAYSRSAKSIVLEEASERNEEMSFGARKFMNYNGFQYNFVNRGMDYNIPEELIGNTLGEITYEFESDASDENLYKEFASNFAVGGIIKECDLYSPDYRVIVELDGKYYICEKTASMYGEPLDIQKYIYDADMGSNVSHISIYDFFGTEKIKDLSTDESWNLLVRISESSVYQVTQWNKEEIQDYESSGKAYMMIANLADGTEMKGYIIPELNLFSLNRDFYYLMPDLTTKE